MIKTNSIQSHITSKYVFRSHDGFLIKAAHIDRPEKHIICLSTQIGCIGKCKFCSAGNLPFIRNLTTMEMIEITNQITKEKHIKAIEPLLVSFMGTGEPMHNIENVVRVGNWLTKSTKFALSTSSYNLHRLPIVPHSMKVQVTLSSPNTKLRRKLQPHVDRFQQLIYYTKYHGGMIEINIPLIAGINDSNEDMYHVVELFRKSHTPIKLNKFHGMYGFIPSNRFSECLEILKSNGLSCEWYETDGEDIQAACGQFELGSG